ncbi:MAG: SH3 domain-containing protein [Anaerolineae bacterium]|nr:SH3 domain-containing protein [Anaerolineae bacterium]
MQKLLWLWLSVLLIWGVQTRAQEVTWSADYIVSDGTTVERLRITPTGAERLTLFTEQEAGVEVVDAAASDDGRYLVVMRRIRDPYLLMPVRLVDTETGRITDIDPLENTQAIHLAGFEPGSTRLAFSYVGADPSNTQIPLAGGMMVVDAASGAITHNVPMSQANAAISAQFQGVWAYMSDWADEGILFTPNCYGCEGVFEGELSAWNPDTDTFISQSGVYFSIFGARLPATNEMLYWTRNTAFPYETEAAFFPIPNVVEYHPQGDIENGGTVIYFESTSANVRRAAWVLDGVAMLAEYNNGQNVGWDVVYRDGQRQGFLSSAASSVQFGTPDGFVALDTQADGITNILHYNLLAGNANILAQIRAGTSYVLARSPQLWGDVPGMPQPFQAIPTLDTEEYTAISAQLGLGCDGFLPSRLVVGQSARVTPGIANRVREYPALDAPLVGSIPGEGVFQVLEGPACDPANGIAWWRVNYQGLEGWTAEGQGSEYWTEPLP